MNKTFSFLFRQRGSSKAQRRYILAGKIKLAGLVTIAIAFLSAVVAWRLYRGDVAEFWRSLLTNVSTELLGMGITVLVLNALYERSQEEGLRSQFIREMASADNGLALRAVAELRAHGWLSDGSLSGIRLCGADLRGADLSGSNLTDTDLTAANLKAADLGEAKMRRANLQRANLQGANMRHSDLEDSLLDDANMQKAFLAETNLRRASLTSANLQGACLWGAVLDESDLAKSDLRGAMYDHQTQWPQGFDLVLAEAINIGVT